MCVRWNERIIYQKHHLFTGPEKKKKICDRISTSPEDDDMEFLKEEACGS